MNRSPNRPPFLLPWIGAALFVARAVSAQTPTTTAPSSPPLDSESPAALARAFLDAASAGDFSEAARYLDWSGLPVRMGERSEQTVARQLLAILRRHGEPRLRELSSRPEGNLRDGLSPREERLATIPTAGGELDLLLERQNLPEGERWLVSSRTVDRIPVLYADPRYGWLGRLLPETYFSFEALGLALWQWIGLFVLVPLGFVSGLVLAWVARRALRSVVRRTKAGWDDLLLQKASGPLRLLLGVFAFQVAIRLLSLPLPLQAALSFVAEALVIVAFASFLLRGIDVLAQVARENPKGRNEAVVSTLTPMLRRAAVFFVVAIALMMLLQNLGFNVSTLLAGLGIGGIAVALAAQKTVENLIGGIALIVDRPAKVGDFCRVGALLGTIEEIGLRSTRIRTLDRSLVTIPNGELSMSHIENLTLRDRFKLQSTLALAYETTPDQLRYILIELKRMLAAHPKVLAEPCRVRLANFGASALEIEIFAYVGTADVEEFFAVREDVFLHVMDVVAAAGAAFAFPTQTVYLKKDEMGDGSRARDAEAKVRAWREAKELMLPDFTPEKLREVENTLDYPPTGSASRSKSTGRS